MFMHGDLVTNDREKIGVSCERYDSKMRNNSAKNHFLRLMPAMFFDPKRSFCAGM